MLRELLQRPKLFSLLYRIDKDLAAQYRVKGCSYCAGPLHQANYPRKPRGGPNDLPEKYMIRNSLCCGRDGCRRRTLPPSCLFMDRRVYWGVVILVVMTLRQKRLHGASTKRLMKMFMINRKTLFRWIQFFREVFPHTDRWQSLRGRISIKVRNAYLPGDFVEYCIHKAANPMRGLIDCLALLANGIP
jgi:hypothetical protein